ncbi:MAG: SURF1 family protein, partial [Rhodobacteraceae bacterium]|nr:SURF1 family protein [Paracoccaceae bacterium]
MRRTIFILIIGLAGIAVLLSLGTWQVQRLAWKEGILAEIDAKISGTPTTLPLSPSEEAHKYLPVEVSGRFFETRIRVLV